MSKITNIGLAVALLALPLAASAQSQTPKTEEQPAGSCPVHQDFVALHQDMDRLSAEASSLAEAIDDSGQKEAALKIQEHVASVIHRIQELEKKMDASDPGLLASFKAGDLKEMKK